MKDLLIVACGVLLLSSSSTAQLFRISQIFDTRYAAPTSVVFHSGRYFTLHVNGQVSFFDSLDIQPKQLATPGEYITSIHSSGGLLWAHSTARHLWYSDAVGSSIVWKKLPQIVRNVFCSKLQGFFVQISDSIFRCIIDGSKVTLDEHSHFQASGPIAAFCVKGDTVATSYFAKDEESSSDSLNIYVKSKLIGQSALPSCPLQFYQLDDGTMFCLSSYRDVMVQYGSLINRLVPITRNLNMSRATSLNTGVVNGETVLLLVGKQAGLSHKFIMVALGPTGYSYRNIGTSSDSASGYRAGTLRDRLVTTVSQSSMVTMTEAGFSRTSIPLLPDSLLQSNFKTVRLLDTIAVVRTLFSNSESRKRIHKFSLNLPNRHILLCDSMSDSFRADSLRSVEDVVGDMNSGYIIFGSLGIASAQSIDGPWVSQLTIPTTVSRRVEDRILSDGSIITQYHGGAYAITRDFGVSWSVHSVPRMFFEFRQAESSSSTLALCNPYSELFLIRQPQEKDTVDATRYVPSGSSLRIIKVEDDLVHTFHLKSTDRLDGKSNSFVLSRVSYNGLIDSIVLLFDPPISFGAYAQYSTKRFGDTTVVFERKSGRLFLVVNGQLVLDYTAEYGKLEPFQSATEANVRINSPRHIELALAQYGIVGHYFPFSYDTTTSIIDNLPTVYIVDPRPNPSNGFITVDIGKFVTNTSSIRLELWSVTGVLAQDYSQMVPLFGAGNERSTISLDVSNVPSGYYLLVVRDSQSAYSQKIIILR